MAVCAYETEQDPLVYKFVQDSDVRLGSQLFLKNSYIEKYDYKDSFFVVVDVNPIFNTNILIYLTAFMAAIIYIFLGISYWLLIPGLFTILLFFTTGAFIFIMNKKALKKVGYTGYIKKINLDDTISRLVELNARF